MHMNWDFGHIKKKQKKTLCLETVSQDDLTKNTLPWHLFLSLHLNSYTVNSQLCSNHRHHPCSHWVTQWGQQFPHTNARLPKHSVLDLCSSQILRFCISEGLCLQHPNQWQQSSAVCVSTLVGPHNAWRFDPESVAIVCLHRCKFDVCAAATVWLSTDPLPVLGTPAQPACALNTEATRPCHS